MPLLCLLLALPALGTVVHFREQFLDGAKWQERWVLSQHKSNYGKFRLTAGSFYGDREADKGLGILFENVSINNKGSISSWASVQADLGGFFPVLYLNDYGLQTSENLRFYAISSRFKPFSNKGKTLVIQYTVKHEQKIDCGGGYVKIFPSDLNQKNMSGESQYFIMFGPDICGSGTKKVHIILNFKNKLYPNKKQIRCKVDGFTHLYTLILRSDHTYEVKIDNEMVASGILEDDWDFLPPRRINDPAVKKPEDWNDEAEIDDPYDTMPEDWNVAEYIVDNGAEKPNDWDDVKQGVWQRPLLKNPLYRGKWQPRKIPNPNYRGIWPHPQIENPVYMPDESISVYENIGVIGLDLWQVRSGTIFDNFLITDSETYAEEFGDETWGETKYPEQKMNQKQIEEEEKREKAREEEKSPKGRVKVPKQQVSRKKKSQTVAEKGEL